MKWKLISQPRTGGTVTSPDTVFSISIGEVTTGETPSASITGTYPDQKLNLVLPVSMKAAGAQVEVDGTSFTITPVEGEPVTLEGLVYDSEGNFTGKGLDAAMRVQYGRTYRVCSPEFGADPTGKKNSRPAIQKAIDLANASGGGTVVLDAGDYLIDSEGLDMKGLVHLKGMGRFVTRLWLDASTVTEDTVERGLIGIGTYGQRLQDRTLFRTSITDLSIQSTYKDGTLSRSSNGSPFQHIGGDNIQNKIWGICYNGYLGSGPAEPDSVHYMDNVEIWDMNGGLALVGLDDQGCQISNFRVRHTLKQGWLIGKPGDHPEAYEAREGAPTKSDRKYGAADNHFVNIDVSSANLSLGGYAGFEIYTSQCCFTQCKSWYHRRSSSGAADLTGTLPTGDSVNIWNFAATQGTMVAGASNPDGDPKRFVKDGAGYYISGRDNVFMGSTSQETGGHGWIVHGSGVQIMGCYADSPGYYDTLRGDAKVNEVAGFLFTNGCQQTQATSCIAKNTYPTHKDARVGFFLQNYSKQVTLRDCKTEKMPFRNGVDASGGEFEAHVPPVNLLQEQVYVDVNDLHVSTFKRDQVSASTGGGAAQLTTAPVIPSEIGGVVAHWDFSDTSKITASGGRVAAAAPILGTSPDGTLVQADEIKKPWISSLAGRQAIKVNKAANEFLQAPNIGTTPIAGGWSLAMVVASNRAVNGQYLYSSIVGTSTTPASITINDKLELRPNSGGGTKGYTAKTAAGSLKLYTPAVVIMTVTGAGVEVWVDGVKSKETPPATGPTADLAGKATIGAYFDGTSGADATFGEVALFSKALTEAEIGGLNAYLSSKWR